MKLKDFPDEERPRERLLNTGAESLSNHELLAILLRTGTKKESVLQQGVLFKIEEHTHSVGHSERSGAVVEPYLSTQWFVQMQPLADAAIELQKSEGKVNFVPDRFEKTYLHWMENIRDWCISRQLWWGHRIPAWYHKETGEIYV